MEENIKSCDECMINPCAECMRYVTGIEFIPDEVLDVNEAMDTNMTSTGGWFVPYNEILKNNGLDTMFFSFKNDTLSVTESTPVDHYTFNTLPDGKCVILGIDENKFFKAVVCTMVDGKLAIIYDPSPEQGSLGEIYEIGFFIRTFMEVTDV
jgi:hypothetical protein